MTIAMKIKIRRYPHGRQRTRISNVKSFFVFPLNPHGLFLRGTLVEIDAIKNNVNLEKK